MAKYDGETFSLFENGHPDFLDYPYAGRTGIIFDHTLHENKHFGKTERAFDCKDCHDPDVAGQRMVIGSFESMCVSCHGDVNSNVPSKVYHHGDQVVGGDPIAVFTLPRLDQKQIKAKQVALGTWPLGTNKGSRSGLTRLGLTPLTELLLASDDDPFVPKESFDNLPENEFLNFNLTKSGGHMGYVSAEKTPLGTHRWLDFAFLTYAEHLLMNKK